MEKTLSALDFSPSEIKVYLYLVEFGKCYASKISRAKKLNRSNVYEALDRLIAKGAVSFVARNKVKWYEAKDPQALYSLARAKEQEITRIKKNLDKEILSLARADTSPLEATVFTGKKGLRVLFDEMLYKKKSISIIAASHQFKSLFGPYFELWHRTRVKKKIVQRSIFPKKFRRKLRARRYLSYKFIDNKYLSPTTTIIYANIVIFIQWLDEPFAIRVENTEIARTHQNYFELLWESK